METCLILSTVRTIFGALQKPSLVFDLPELRIFLDIAGPRPALDRLSIRIFVYITVPSTGGVELFTAWKANGWENVQKKK